MLTLLFDVNLVLVLDLNRRSLRRHVSSHLSYYSNITGPVLVMFAVRSFKRSISLDLQAVK